jgi:uncharacterized cupin superfamily protein
MLAHWDEVEGEERSVGHLRGTWFDLGRAAASVDAGVKRVVLPPGAWSTPAHVHGRNEEIFFVLAGSGLSWQDGETYEVGRGDCLVHVVGGEAHTLLAGEGGLDVLAFGTRLWDEAPTLPGARTARLGEGWVAVGGDEDHPWAREAAVGPPALPPAPSPRPPSIVNVADLEPYRDPPPPGFRSDWRDAGRAAGSQRSGLKLQRIEPGNLNAPHHVHSAEEELFVLLEGDGVLELVPGPTRARGAQERIRCAPATSSRGPRARVSPTPSSPATRA